MEQEKKKTPYAGTVGYAGGFKKSPYLCLEDFLFDPA